MLLRWAMTEDKPVWLALLREYDKYISEFTGNMDLWYDGFNKYMAVSESADFAETSDRLIREELTTVWRC